MLIGISFPFLFARIHFSYTRYLLSHFLNSYSLQQAAARPFIVSQITRLKSRLILPTLLLALRSPFVIAQPQPSARHCHAVSFLLPLREYYVLPKRSTSQQKYHNKRKKSLRLALANYIVILTRLLHANIWCLHSPVVE
jgi:hypothetical protein